MPIGCQASNPERRDLRSGTQRAPTGAKNERGALARPGRPATFYRPAMAREVEVSASCRSRPDRLIQAVMTPAVVERSAPLRVTATVVGRPARRRDAAPERQLQ